MPRPSVPRRAALGNVQSKTFFNAVAPEYDAIVTVDISPGMLERLAEKYPNVEVVPGDVAQYVATDPEPFDLIAAFGVFELLPDIAPPLTPLCGKLNPGGLFCFFYEPLLQQHATQGQPETTYRIDVSPNVT